MISYRQADLLKKLITHRFTSEIWERRPTNYSSVEFYCHRMKVDSSGSADLVQFANIVIGNTLMHVGYSKPFNKQSEFDFIKKVDNSYDAMQREYEYISSYLEQQGNHHTISDRDFDYDATIECRLEGEGVTQHISIILTMVKK
jgi:hypothetical protein